MRKLVVLTFSKLPNTIPGLLPTLLQGSRPDCSSRLISLQRNAQRSRRKIAQKLGLQLDPETQRYASKGSQPLGGLCAALVQAASEFATFRLKPTSDNMREYLDRRNPLQQWTLDQLVHTVAKYFSVSVVEMRSKKRLKTLVLARKYFALLARYLTDATLQEIGAQLSSRDHSTILYSVRELEETLQNDEQARHDLREILRRLNVEPPEEITKLANTEQTD